MLWAHRWQCVDANDFALHLEMMLTPHTWVHNPNNEKDNPTGIEWIAAKLAGSTYSQIPDPNHGFWKALDPQGTLGQMVTIPEAFDAAWRNKDPELCKLVASQRKDQFKGPFADPYLKVVESLENVEAKPELLCV